LEANQEKIQQIGHKRQSTESAAVWKLNPEGWGSSLVQEKFQGGKTCDKKH
jgi:hypothetical protein